ncbi:transporter family protein [Geomesophilobacter sediminis]|uniref:Transporter n=1 Tax=Geomesophilobacter sediminis TaxID=2798584 RepID=A0A8J7LYQ7_9BACT|nr:hypothetical protein [Geomesophilobacter sediminis]MBJ6725272.1 hypothetical protein [Geomesophilobacter sediminis]
MKKMILAAVGVMLAATPALAEHKLLVTDVLDPKQVEAQAKFEHTYLSGSLSNPSGTTSVRATESLYSVGVGLLPGLEMTAFIPYVFNEREKAQFTGFDPEVDKKDGFGDFALEAKYRLLGGEHEPFTVVAGLDLKFDTAGNKNGDAGTGTTDFAPFIAASANLGHHTIPYAIYQATLRNHDTRDTHTISLGLEKELNETFTLDGRFDANFNTSDDTVTANERYVFELASYIQVAHNLYVLPAAAYIKESDSTLKATNTKIGSVDGYRVGASLYYLY